MSMKRIWDTKLDHEQLFGPLPPPTRRRPGPSILDRRRKLQLRQLSKLPPLPPSPPPTPPDQPNNPIDINTLLDNINQDLDRIHITNHNPSSLAPRPTNPPSFPPDLNRPPSPFISTVSHIFTQFLA
ncbi:hypothetical protein Pst134EA_017485 [Puccinia striiformis f. sp. tritici]|uniref:hypothetical protein n=1 Tax=Puccinia striiformis f. sp. tritici TaxID=168172 RepID=UPI002008705A|nr:hypothetical protein Pst134EA_017485 [Puccinia striiformis f. sp. tritici]KAH9450882.1 hypothetical protein Pst134EB_018391 [Puccinia striiformis f. sp. tritici]KAH9461175.1 hypothetical protein Pst134EA_017485 [Puccinia striiformis f. sp. tritici]